MQQTQSRRQRNVKRTAFVDERYPVLVMIAVVVVGLFAIGFIWLMGVAGEESDVKTLAAQSYPASNSSSQQTNSPVPRSKNPYASLEQHPTSQEFATLQSLTDTCRFWIGQQTQSYAPILRKAACDDLRNYAQSLGISPPEMYASLNTQLTPNQQPDAFNYAVNRTVGFDVCRASYPRGSIKFRECRRSVKQGLHEQCKRLTQELLAVANPPRDGLREAQQQTCAAEAAYEIMD